MVEAWQLSESGVSSEGGCDPRKATLRPALMFCPLALSGVSLPLFRSFPSSMSVQLF